MRHFLKRYTIILCLLGLALLIGPSCRKKQPCNCQYPIDDYVDESHYWLLRNHLINTLRFNMYRIEVMNGTRIYKKIGEETFAGLDSTVEVLYDERGGNLTGSNDCICIEAYNIHQIALSFKGNQYNLRQMLKPFGNFDLLRIVIANRDYHLYPDAFDHEPSYNTYNVEGQRYSDVYCCKGFHYTPLGNTLYDDKDSTYAFYNYQNGLIKVIVNDTLAFLRKP